MRKLTTEEFIIRAKDVHGDRYDYSLIKYKNSHTKVKIICEDHSTFEQRPNDHLTGNGCPKCSGRHKSTKDYIIEAKRIHGNKYNYDKVQYTKPDSKIKIRCLRHGEFMQSPSNHLTGNGCPKCAHERRNNENRLTIKQFIKKAIKIHGNKYDYAEVIYTNSKEKVKIKCKEHGIFEQKAYHHLEGHGCRKCNAKQPSGESHHWYKHGKTKEHIKERQTPENRQWIKLVKKDKTNCDCCGTAFSENFTKHAHHLNSWVDHPLERYDLNNGVAICEDCHLEFHETYGYGHNTKEQYYQFKEIKQMEN